ncbi:SDR family NAD(P)-dependent oxidoreductase [Dactylosporangium sp. CA-092794]|uniref:SDR family NAD(P)-dependent oxidoreductase n=1 Tax=Dactylosporangium sp. CA-092794 TaxID=3239929 RepID=UPI003D89DEDE
MTNSYASPSALEGKACIVTGAAQGIGRGIAQALTERGAAVLLVDHNPDTLAATAAALSADGRRAEPLLSDIRGPAEPDRIAATAVERFGRLDVLVNNAIATRPAGPFTEHTDADYDLVFDTGPRATFRLMRAAFPHLAASGAGSVINLGSSAGTEGQAGWATYAAAKEAIRGFSKVAATEWGAAQVRVNVICPFANSEGAQLWERFDPDGFNAALAKVPLGRIGDTRTDIGALVAFLAGDESTYITGQTIMIDGGWGMHRI